MAVKEMSFSSGVNDALYSEDIDEDEIYLINENLDLPTIHWINSKNGYKHYCEVLERIAVTETSETTESTIARRLLDARKSNVKVVFDFLNEVSTCFNLCYENVEGIKCTKTKMIKLERNFGSLSSNVSLNRIWCCLLSSCELSSTSTHGKVVLNHILQHFWSCLLLYKSHAVNTGPSSSNGCYGLSAVESEIENIEVQSINEHSGWVCKRVRDTFKDGPPVCKIQVSRTNNKCIEVGKQYIMDLIKRLGEDKLVQPGKFLFVPYPETVQVFIYLHAAVENIVKVNITDKDILKHCLQILSRSCELRDLWYKVLCGDDDDEIFTAARVLILQRVAAFFVKSKQQIIREQLMLKAKKQGTSFRQTLKKTTSVKKVKKQPTENEMKIYECVKELRKDPQNSSCVTLFLTETFANSADAPNILNNLKGRELSKILQSLGLPGLVGKSKNKQIDELLKHNAQGKGWIIVYPDKLKEDHQS